MSRPSPLVRSLALAFTVGFILVEAAEEKSSSEDHTENGEHETGDSEADGEDEDEEEEGGEVLAKTDGRSIALCILGIMTALIAITCLFEQVKDMIYEATEKPSLPIVDALFSEMTVLGFLSMVTFIVASEGFITYLSVIVFGDTPKGQEYLKELFEAAHYMLFLVMVIFFIIAVWILHMNNKSIEHLRSLRDKVLRNDYHVEQLEVARGAPPSMFDSWEKRQKYHRACEFLEYMSMRREFIHGRKSTEPHKELHEDDWLPLDFDYAKYLSIRLGRMVAEMIDVDVWTWVQLWCLNVFMWLLLLAFPPVGKQCLVVCVSWVVIGYLEAGFIVCFAHKARQVRWCLSCPSEIPHIEFTYDPATGMPTARRRTSAVDASSLTHSANLLHASAVVNPSGGGGGSYSVGVEMTKKSRFEKRMSSRDIILESRRSSPTAMGNAHAQKMSFRAADHTEEEEESKNGASSSQFTPYQNESGVGSRAAAEELAAEDQMEVAREHMGGRADVPWASIKVNLETRTKFQQWLGGRAPYKQMYLYWHEAHAPWLHLTILRLHLVFTAIGICLLALVFAPLIKEHFGFTWYVVYLLSPVPHLVYTIGFEVAKLTRVVTEIGSHGILADKKTTKEVLRMMKTEKSVKGVVMLSNMKHFMNANRGGGGGSGAGAAKPGGGGGGELNASNNGGGVMAVLEYDDVDGLGTMTPEDVTRVLTKLFEEKFDDRNDGFINFSDFGVGLAQLGDFGAEQDLKLAYALAGASRPSTSLNVDQFRDFAKKFLGPKKEWSSGLSQSQFAVGTRLSAAFHEYMAKKMGDEGLTAEEELALLHREHGRVVHELVLLFDQYDEDGNGTLDAEEVRKMVGTLGEDLSEAEARSLVSHLDRDGDGDVSLAEFVIWAFKRQQEATPDNVEELAGEIFDRVFDQSQDGKIDVNEFIDGLDRLKSELTYDEKHDLFREADENSGGTIDKEEFVALIMNYA